MRALDVEAMRWRRAAGCGHPIAGLSLALILVLLPGGAAGQPLGSGCRLPASPPSFPDAGYLFIQQLVRPETGLVSSLEDECFTTVYKNALAAIAFLHQGDTAQAETIFQFFQDRLPDPFPGFHQVWNPCTGEPDAGSDLWEGDNAVLLSALNDYSTVTGSYGAFEPLRSALAEWLTARSTECSLIVAEGVANMYAALFPFGDYDTLGLLGLCFFSQADYPNVLDHTNRGALVFGDYRGFESTLTFARTETWQCDETTVIDALAAFTGEAFVNTEISAQALAAWRISRERLPGDLQDLDLAPLRDELEKLALESEAGNGAGLPYFVRQHGFPGDFSLPIVDTTAWLLFDDWRLNPFTASKPPCDRAAVNPWTADRQDLDHTADDWGVFCEQAPTWALRNVADPSLDGIALECALTAGAPHSNVHCYRNLLPEPAAIRFRLDTSFRFTPETTCANAGSPSVVQALELTMNKFFAGRRWEWALQWQNVGAGAPNWRYWDGNQAAADRWVDLMPAPCLAADVWHTFSLDGEIVDDQVHYSAFSLDGVSHAIDLTVDPVDTGPEQVDLLAVAFQLDGNFESAPYQLFVDDVSFERTASEIFADGFESGDCANWSGGTGC
jgi:hypothetical protein